MQDGRITLLEEGAHDVLSMLANKSSGIWFGSARAFAANCGAGDVSERQARHLLEALEKKGYIRRFPTPRAHGNYPILINKYEVTFGAQRGMRLNALASIDWRNPVYETCAEQGAEQGAEQAPYQEVEVEVEVETKPCANHEGSHDVAVPSSDQKLDFGPSVDRVWDYYIQKLEKNPKLVSFTGSRRRKGLARFHECLKKTGNDPAKAEALMRIAVDSLAASRFHRGENEQNKKYDSWEKNLFPSQERLETWLEQG